MGFFKIKKLKVVWLEDTPLLTCFLIVKQYTQGCSSCFKKIENKRDNYRMFKKNNTRTIFLFVNLIASHKKVIKILIVL